MDKKRKKELVSEYIKVLEREWEAVALEARALAGVLPLVFARLDRPWSPVITMSDASLSGWAFGHKSLGAAAIQEVGRVPERNRYRCREVTLPPRESALVAADVCDRHSQPA